MTTINQAMNGESRHPTAALHDTLSYEAMLMAFTTLLVAASAKAVHIVSLNGFHLLFGSFPL